mgnify:CR=1 FL=1
MKILNEKYLQQRIEELEKEEKYNSYQEIRNDWWENQIRVKELKQLLANCEEVEVREFNNSDYDDVGYLKSKGYKLIKTK